MSRRWPSLLSEMRPGAVPTGRQAEMFTLLDAVGVAGSDDDPPLRFCGTWEKVHLLPKRQKPLCYALVNGEKVFVMLEIRTF